MHINKIIKRLFVSFALLTSVGTLVHDTKLNKAYDMSLLLATADVNLPAHLNSIKDATQHTHVDSSSVVRITQEGTPRIQPRDDRRHYMPKYLSRDNANFGASGVIWPNV